MQKNVPIVVVVVVLLVVVIAVASLAGRRRQGGPAVSGTSVSTTPKRPALTRVQVKQQKVLTAALDEAQKLYDAKDYKGALQKTKEILEKIDATSQLAKNLKQMAQRRMSDQARAGTP